MTKLKPVPPVRLSPDQRNLQQPISALTEIAETLAGNRNELDRALTWRDLATTGLVTLKRSFAPGSNPVEVPEPEDPAQGGGYMEIPPKPVNVRVGATTVAFIGWEVPGYSNHSHTEVWRNTTNNRDTATRLGTSPDVLFVDRTVDTGKTYYYWARFVSTAGTAGDYNMVDGTEVRPPSTNAWQLVVADQVLGGVISGVTFHGGAYVGAKFLAGINGDGQGRQMSYSSVQGYDAQGKPVWVQANGYFKAVIDEFGNAEFANIKARGDIQASSIGESCPVPFANITNVVIQEAHIASASIGTLKLQSGAASAMMVSAFKTHPDISGFSSIQWRRVAYFNYIDHWLDEDSSIFASAVTPGAHNDIGATSETALQVRFIGVGGQTWVRNLASWNWDWGGGYQSPNLMGGVNFSGFPRGLVDRVEVHFGYRGIGTNVNINTSVILGKR